MSPPKLIDEVMERWDVLHQNTNQIVRALAGLWKLDEPQVDRIVSKVLGQRWSDRKKGVAC